MFSFSAEPPAIKPSFARDAAEYVRNGDIERAIELCTRGTAAFPRYATGYLMLGKCYESLGQAAESLVEYRRALNILPDNLELQQLVKHAEEREQKQIKKLAREQEKKLEAKKETTIINDFPAQNSSGNQTGIEHLAKRLQDVTRLQPVPPPNSTMNSELTENHHGFVTETMAEIYASQGTYGESIRAYREILKRHPEKKERFEKRIRELEQLRTNQHKEKKSEGPNTTKAS